MREADLLIVMGTSLTVQPFASLAQRVDDSCPRVLINLDRVGDFGSRSDDVVLLGKCDDIVRDLCKELGWEDELIKLWHETEDTIEKEDVDGKSELGTLVGVDEEVESLTAAIEKSLALNEAAVDPANVNARSAQKDSASLSDSSTADPRDDGKLKIPLAPPPKDIKKTTPETSPKLKG
jgi:NAD-dependent histone deacetylase SIR2